jgi:hypothetical protein
VCRVYIDRYCCRQACIRLLLMSAKLVLIVYAFLLSHCLCFPPFQHTWGVAMAWFLPDYTNYSNTQFDLARAQQVNGFVKVR